MLLDQKSLGLWINVVADVVNERERKVQVTSGDQAEFCSHECGTEIAQQV